VSSPPAPYPPPERSPERIRIEKAVEAVVVERGYPNATLEEVCERAGVDRAAFERHFADLEAAYLEMIGRERDEFIRRVAGAFAEQSTWRDQIRAAAWAMYGYLAEDNRRARFVFVEVLSAGEQAQLVRDVGMELLFDLIDLGRAELADPDLLTRVTAEAIGGSVYNQLQLAVERDSLNFDFARQLLYLVVLPYAGTEAALEELSMPAPWP
jgi:AcrR family transcriptional regulator